MTSINLEDFEILKKFISHFALHTPDGGYFMIIGLTGTLAAGKGEFCSYMAEKGFVVYSLSDIIREELRKKGIEITRESLQDTGNELRTKHGPSVLARMTITKLEKRKDYVIDSIRNPEEVKALRELPAFQLFFIDAPIKLRYERIVGRKREGDEKVSFKVFEEQEKRELLSRNPASQQLLACKKMADKKIRNDSSLEAFRRRIDAAIREGEHGS
jgi:dephospho-CoA kinase